MNINENVKYNFDLLTRNLDIVNVDDKTYIDKILLDCGNQTFNKTVKYSTCSFPQGRITQDMTMSDMLNNLKTKHNWSVDTFNYIKNGLGI